MITGGVPYYLSHVKKGLSATQIIEQLAFSEKGFLLEEFDHLFSSLFENADIYIKLIKTISKKQWAEKP